MQFVQEEKSGIIIKMVIDEARFTERDRERVLDEMRYRFGDDMDFEIRVVPKIDREKSGKYCLIKNRLQEGR